jgi:2-dehydropantoate 2-reductase
MNGGESLPIAVLGAGAVGCYYGGMLARAGHPVTLIGRALHVKAFEKRGLRFEALKFDERVAVAASTKAAAVRGAKLVLFCVKSTDTDAAATQIAPFLEPDACVVNLQNGVDNTERIERVLRTAKISCPVVPAVVYVATEMAGPGHLKHHGRGDLVIGSLGDRVTLDVLQRVQRLFGAAGVPVTISGDVAGELWGKLVVNCAYNALSAITQLPYGKLIVGAGVRELMRDLVEETLAVAAASGIHLAPDTLAKTYKIADAMPTQFSSTAQDLARGKPTEIDHLNGFVARRGAALGIPAPANRALCALVKLLESKPRAKSKPT